MTATELTFLQIVNRVLSRMRESTVSTYNETDYSTMVGHMVNQVKAEIEAAWYWHALRDTYSVAATNPNASYALTGTSSKAVILEGWNRTYGSLMKKSSNRRFNELFFGTPSGTAVQTGAIDKWLQSGLDSNYDVIVEVYPVPDVAQTLAFNVYVPQAELSDGSTICRIPQNVLIEEVIARLMHERGDENAPQPVPGQTFLRADLLAAAIVDDQSVDHNEMDWEAE